MRKNYITTATNISINLRNMSYSIYSIFLSTASRGHIPDTATTNNNIIMKNKTEMKTEKKSAKKSAKKK